MEALHMSKQWRGGSGGFSSSATPVTTAIDARTPGACTVASAVLGHSLEMDDDDDFIDLEFTLPYDLDEEQDESVEGDAEKERFGFTLSSTVAGECCKPNHRHVSNSLLKSATKFRVLMLSLKRSKSAQQDPSPKQQNLQEYQQHHQSSNKFSVTLKGEETPLVSLFARDNSSRSTSSSGRDSKYSLAEENEKKNSNNSKDMVQKYLNKIKPLYVRVSKHYGGKSRFTGPLGSTGKIGPTETVPSATPCHTKEFHKPQAAVSLPSGFKVVCRRLGKSRSASSTISAAPSPPTLPRRRDDSLLQQQDGIQSAIAHCKRSFQAPKAAPEYPTELVRSNSDPGEKRPEKIPV